MAAPDVSPATACARSRCSASMVRGDRAGRGRPRVPAVRRRTVAACASRSASMPGQFAALDRRAAQEAKDAAGMGHPGDPAVRPARREGSPGLGGLGRGRHRAAGGAGGEGQRAGSAGDHRRLPLRVHEPRALRRGRGRRASATIPRWSCWPAPPSRTPRPARTSSRRPDMMDGRVGAIREAPRRGLARRDADHGLLGEVRLGVLRPASARPRDSTPQFGDRRSLPDGPGQRARRRMREIALDHRRGRGHRDGQAGAAVSRHHRARQGGVRRAAGRLLGVRRVRDDPGGRASWAGSTRSARCWRRSPSIRRAGRRHRHHVLRQGRRRACSSAARICAELTRHVDADLGQGRVRDQGRCWTSPCTARGTLVPIQEIAGAPGHPAALPGAGAARPQARGTADVQARARPAAII